MHIDLDTTKNTKDRRKLATKSKPRESHAEKTSFSDMVIGHLNTGLIPDNISEVIDKLDQYASDLTENPDMYNLNKYKAAVFQAADFLLTKAFKLRAWSDRNKKKFEVVKILDQKLNQLYQALFVNRHMSTALRTVGAIKGILLNELR